MHVSTEQVSVFLLARLGTRVTGLQPVGRGEWSQAFVYSVAGRRMIIRFSEFNEDFEKDRFAARFSSLRLPIPPVEELGQALGRHYAISPFIEGTMIEDLSAGELRAAVPALLELLDALRTTSAAGAKGYGGFDGAGIGSAHTWREHLQSMPEDEPGSRLEGWRKRLAHYPAAAAAFRAGRERLERLLPCCPEARHLVHNDLLHYNLILREGQVVGVIDWGCALWGDFLYDLALITAWQFYYPAMAGIDFAGLARQFLAGRGAALENFGARLLCYQVHLLLDGMIYNAWRENATDLEMTARRLSEVLASPDA